MSATPHKPPSRLTCNEPGCGQPAQITPGLCTDHAYVASLPPELRAGARSYIDGARNAARKRKRK